MDAMDRPPAEPLAIRTADALRFLGVDAEVDTIAPHIASVRSDDMPGWSFHVHTMPIGPHDTPKQPGWFAMRSTGTYDADPVRSPLDRIAWDAPATDVVDAILLCVYGGDGTMDAAQIRAARLGPDGAEYLRRCRNRALDHLRAGDVRGAFLLMISDVRKHPATAGHPAGAQIGALLAKGGLHEPRQVREFIERFH